jgi:hypothetical protein
LQLLLAGGQKAAEQSALPVGKAITIVYVGDRNLLASMLTAPKPPK